MNIERRHQIASQRACLAVDLLPFYEQEAKERQKRKPVDSIQDKIPEQKSQARDHVAKQVLEKAQPEVIAGIEAGAMSIHEAQKKEKERCRQEQRAQIAALGAADAHLEEPSLHDFRRAFALAMLRNGTDLYTLAKLMGHEGITVLQRYLKQTYQDTEQAHRRAGPVDNSGLLGLVVGVNQ